MKARNVSIVHVDYVAVCSGGNNEMCHLCECCSPKSEEKEDYYAISIVKMIYYNKPHLYTKWVHSNNGQIYDIYKITQK